MKKSTMKGAFALTAVLALGLGACGGGSSDSKATGGSDTSASAESDSSEPIQIEYLHRLPDGDNMVKVSEIVDRWNKDHPNIQVKATKFDGKAQELIKKLETDVKANNAVCLAQIGYSEAAEVYVKNLVEDVTAEADKYKDDFAPGPYSQMAVDGKQIGLPQDTGPLVYYYNADAFEKLGIQVPTNLEEFKAAAQTAAAQGKYIADWQADEAAMLLSGQTAAAGGKWYTIDGDTWNVDMSSEAVQTVAGFWQDLVDNKLVLTNPRWDDSFGAALNDGSLIGTIGAGWEAPLLAETMAGTDNVGKWRVAKLPDFGAGQKTGADGGSGVAVIKGCPHPAEAVEFIDWFNTQVDDLATQGLITAAKGDSKTPDNLTQFYGNQDVMGLFKEANDEMAEGFIYIPSFSSVLAQMSETGSSVSNGSGSVLDVFKAGEDASVKALQDLGISVNK